MEAGNLGKIVLVYEKFAKAENKSDRTIEAITDAATKFDIFLGGNVDPRNVQASDLRHYNLYLQNRPKWLGHPTIKPNHGKLSSNVVSFNIRHIKALWSWMLREGFIEQNPLATVKTPKESLKDVTPLLPDEVNTVLKVIPRNNYRGYRDSTIILALYGTLLRISELLELPPDDINFSSGQIKVLGKGDRERSVFMSPKLYKAMFKYQTRWRPKDISSYFFIHENGSRLTRFYFAHRMKIYVQQAGISKPCTPHLLRYAGAIQLLRNGCDPFTLQNIMGHTTMDMTRRYLKIASSDVERSLKLFSPAEQIEIGF
jgi:site-specific recombinase XerD